MVNSNSSAHIGNFVLQHLRHLDPRDVIFIGIYPKGQRICVSDLLIRIESGDEELLNQLAGEFINYLTENRSEPYEPGHVALDAAVESADIQSLPTLTGVLNTQMKRVYAKAYHDKVFPNLRDYPGVARLIIKIHSLLT